MFITRICLKQTQLTLSVMHNLLALSGFITEAMFFITAREADG